MKLNSIKEALLNELISQYGSVVTRKQVVDFVKSRGANFTGSSIPAGVKFPHWITNNKEVRVGRGRYDLRLFYKNKTTVETIEATV